MNKKRLIFIVSIVAFAFIVHADYERFTLKEDVFKSGIFKVAGQCALFSDKKITQVYFYCFEKKQLKKIGGKGQGPGEYDRIESLQLLGDEIIVSCTNKVIFYDREGKLKNEKKKNPEIKNLLKARTNWVGIRIFMDKKDIFMVVGLYNPDLIETKQLVKIKLPSPFEGKIEAIEKCTKIEVSKDRIFIPDPDQGQFQIFTSKGKELAPFKFPSLTRMKVSDAFKERMISELKASPTIAPNWELIKDKLVFRDELPVFDNFVVNLKGAIMIRTYAEEDGENVYYLMKERKKVPQRLTLPKRSEDDLGTTHFAFEMDYIYYLMENKEGTLDLVRKPLILK